MNRWIPDPSYHHQGLSSPNFDSSVLVISQIQENQEIREIQGIRAQSTGHVTRFAFANWHCGAVYLSHL